MRILHTSDWHLGKTLEGFSRLEEQEKFVDELIQIVRDNAVELVIIAGDVYDTSNPPAAAESLFYRALKEITKDNKTGILVISGNHDSPERLTAPSPITGERGIILLGTPKSFVSKGRYGCIEVVDSGEGFMEISINGEKAVIITMPYPSEKRLNEIFADEFKEEERQKSYSERIGELFTDLSQKYREDTINLVVSHIYIVGGQTSDSERPIQLGGSYGVEMDKLPEKAQYIALGHLHRPQKMEYEGRSIYYSGSPLQYSKSEISYSKCAYLVDIKPQCKAKVKEVMFKNYRPIELWKCIDVESALEECKKEPGKNAWIYVEIKTDRVIAQSEMKEMRDLQPGILEIKPIIEAEDSEVAVGDSMEALDTRELFTGFYKSRRQVEPSEEILELFMKMVEEVDESETQQA